jgi:hypothetical protein
VAGADRIVRHHLEDEEFARLFLEGLFSTMLCRARNNGVSDPAWVSAMAEEAGLGPAEYFVDVSMLEGIPMNTHGLLAGNVVSMPTRILLSKLDGRLRPVAIGLQYAGNMWKTHLPRHTTWEVAKLHAKCGAGQEHQLIQHALHTHFTAEVFAVALEIHAPIEHFIHKLLKPHFRYTVDINFKVSGVFLLYYIVDWISCEFKSCVEFF